MLLSFDVRWVFDLDIIALEREKPCNFLFKSFQMYYTLLANSYSFQISAVLFHISFQIIISYYFRENVKTSNGKQQQRLPLVSALVAGASCLS